MPFRHSMIRLLKAHQVEQARQAEAATREGIKQAREYGRARLDENTARLKLNEGRDRTGGWT